MRCFALIEVSFSRSSFKTSSPTSGEMAFLPLAFLVIFAANGLAQQFGLTEEGILPALLLYFIDVIFCSVLCYSAQWQNRQLSHRIEQFYHALI